MRAYCLFFILFLGSITQVFSQSRQISGVVTAGDNNQPLQGVTVTVKGSSNAVTTDAQGTYKINAAQNATLVFSSTGYTSAEEAINGRTTIAVTLSANRQNLDDVVVIGYSSVRRKDLTSSVSSVNAKQLKDNPLSNAAEALTGRLAGVQVSTTEGSPGADVLIRVRGGGSITQDNSPIYIVDGIQVENALSTISPQDIASIDVLKDASSTAIYGARGANGVVIITTKSGRAGKTVVSYNGSAGFREIFKKMDLLDPYEFVKWQYERNKLTPDTSFSRTYGSTWDTLNVYKNIEDIDWQERVFGRKAMYQNHNVSVSGGSQNTTYNLSLTSNKEDGILLQSAFDRKLVNFKLDNRATDRFRVGVTVRYLDQTINGAGTSASGTRTTNRLRNTIQYRPFETNTVISADQFDEDYYQRSSGIINPVLLTMAEYRNATTKGVNLSGYFSYVLAKNLTFKSTAGFDNTSSRQDQFYSKITGTARNFANLPVASISQQNSSTINNSNTLQYVMNGIAVKHDLDLLVGQEIYETKGRNTGMETRYFPADITADKALANMGLGSAPAGAAQPRSTSSVAPPNRIFSFFGRANYSFDKKILASVSVRADRSTKFKYENGLLLFPSATLAYRFSQEKFMEPIKFINDAKIRIGYGTAGNNRIGDLLYLQLYGVTGEYALNHTLVPGFAPTALANENLKWERTISQNLGIDLSLFDNRVQFTTDVYYNKGQDLLLSVAIPPTSGYTSQIRNLGSTSNKGLEFQVSASVIQRKDFTWTSTFNLSFNRNKVLNLGPITQQTRSAGWQGSDGADDYLVKVGQPVGLMYGFVTDNFYKVEDFDFNPTTQAYTLKAGIPSDAFIVGTVRPGSLKIKDIDGDGVISTDKDRTIIGNANPKFTGGWNNQFAYKNFDMSVFVNWVVGNDIYNANKIEWTDGSYTNLNLLATMKDRWTNIDANGNLVTDPTALAKQNENAKIWSPNNSNRFFLHSWAIEDGSFLRVNNLTLGYTLPSSLLTKVKMTSFRFYATVNNLATITGYSGYDPEVSTRRADPLTQGVDFAGYPRSKTWVFGLNVTF